VIVRESAPEATAFGLRERDAVDLCFGIGRLYGAGDARESAPAGDQVVEYEHVLCRQLSGGVSGLVELRTRSLYYDGEIYELYMRPEFQGLGFGRRLFTAARRDLAQNALKSRIAWVLSDNEKAVEFYRALGGKAVARSSEKFGTRVLDKVAFNWRG